MFKLYTRYKNYATKPTITVVEVSKKDGWAPLVEIN
jgi:hypothetical protein